MPSSETLFQQITSETLKLYRLDEEAKKLRAEIQSLSHEITQATIKRSDRESAIAFTKVAEPMIQRSLDEGDIREDITQKLREALSGATAGTDVSAALSDILEMVKRAVSFREESIKEFQRARFRLAELLEESKPKA